jgi:hypothetical protein
MIRRTALPDDEVPHYFEGIPLKTWVLVAGWPLGLACAVGGVALAARASGFAAELSGVVAAALGSVMIVALLRCRRFEIVVGARLLTVGAGPVLRRVPVGLIDRVEDRAGTSWRRLYSDRELVLGLTAGTREIVIPCNQPEELLSTIQTASRSHVTTPSLR